MKERWAVRLAWMALGIGALYAASAMAGVVSGGSLDPPGPVGSTMKSLADIAPSWHSRLDATGSCPSERFECVLGSSGVLDNETGLVWEQAPNFNTYTWPAAFNRCADLDPNLEGGWRIPELHELTSLLDARVLEGSAFANMDETAQFWTSTPSSSAPNMMYVVDFTTGGSSNVTAATYRERSWRVWCVRSDGVEAAAPYDEPFGSWDQALPSGPSSTYPDPCATPRFKCVLSGDGVLDRETGLVWRITPDSTDVTWTSAHGTCLAAGMNGSGPSARFGWRLPTADELATLMTFGTTDALPDNHPFTLVNFDAQEYWTDSDGSPSTTAITLGYKQGGSPFRIQDKASFFADALCVRGGAGSR